ncbi:amidase signature domain-containing protein [Aspergillus foveolatus]|uniref:amidase signature domain-containing protein n=1 Tax=Aspergillus foveolatus TaxID=210207 RepID=UPI003CCE2957
MRVPCKHDPRSLTGMLNAKSDDLRNLAARYNIRIKPGPEEDAYLPLLQSAEAPHRIIRDTTDYVHPDLPPVPIRAAREFRTLPSAENPLNVWSHVSNITAANPINTLIAGRTVVVKDNVSVAGLPATLGIPAWLHSKTGEYQPSPIDATVVRRLLLAGATLKGTATCESFSAAPVPFTSAIGAVHNPWARGHTAGGSSSGCSALIGQRAVLEESGSAIDGSHQESPTVELAVGGNQGGSIRAPAAYTGVYGLKPTHGLVPYTGAISLTPMIDHLGPMATKIEDIALMLRFMAGYDGLDARMTPESPMPGQVKDYPALLADFIESARSATAQKPVMKVGLLREAFDFPGLSAEVRGTVLQNAKAYFTAAGAEILEVSVPMHREAPAIWTVAARTSLADYGFAMKPPGYLSYAPDHIDTAGNPTIMNLIFSTDYLRETFGTGVEFKGHRKVFELRAAYDAVLSEVDVLITPTVPTVAFEFPPSTRGCTEWGDIGERVGAAVGLSYNTCPFNVTGHPAMNVPCGSEGCDGKKLPIGMQVIGKRWDDEGVLKAAALFEMGRDGL